MALFLGIDGGQSSTIAVIGDEKGSILGTGRGGPCNHVSAAEQRAKFTRVILACVRAACAGAQLDPEDLVFEAVCAGLSGGPEDKEPIIREILKAKHYFFTTDAVVALAGATGGDPGLITIAGTGSISYGRNAQRRFARVGGWGYIFGDEGSGFDIARQAVRAVLRSEEGWGPETALASVLLGITSSTNAHELMHRLYTTEYPRSVVATYAKLVDDTAAAGDAVARNIILNAAQQLATATSAVRSQIFQPREHALVAPVGGVFRSEMLRERFRLLVELEDGNQVIEPRYGPGTGALIEAWALTGIHPTITGAPIEK